jgi:fructokinase
VGKIVTLGEVVADVYQEQTPSEVELRFTARPGGAPANVAVAVAKLGAQASFVGRLGDDLFGDFILRALHAVGVETAAVRRVPPPTRTTLAFVEVSKDGNREFTFYRSAPAADELLAPEDIRRESLSGASFANFGSIPLIKDPVRSATRKFAQLASEMDVPVAFDVNPARTPLEQPRRVPRGHRAHAWPCDRDKAQRTRTSSARPFEGSRTSHLLRARFRPV